jgi:hypothetical protein
MASIIRIKRSSGTSKPSSLDWGEFGYTTGIGSYGGTNQYKDRVFLGDDGNNVNPIGGYYYTSMMEHAPGAIQGVQNTRNTDNGVVAVLAPSSNTGLGGANSLKVDQWNVDNIRIDGSVISSTDTDGDINLDPNGTGRLVVGSDVDVSGIVTATSYIGNQVIGTPAGGFKSGAFTINDTDHTKDSINELNHILGKLVPTAPDTLSGLNLSLTGTAGVGRLCNGFTPTNNTSGDLTPVVGSQYTRNTDSTITSNYINDVGPGDSGTVTGSVNGTSVGSITLDSNVNNGTNGALQIADNKDAAGSTRNAGITSQFYQVYDVRLIDAASPDGFNKARITHSSNSSNFVYWYEDPSTVTAPVISFSAVTPPSSPTLNYSSGVPHYTQATANNFTYDVTVTNASGDMYTQNKLLNSDGQTAGFQNPGHKEYDDFTGGTLPPARNFGVGTGAVVNIAQTPRDLHLTLTSNHFTRFDAVTPYGSHNNQRLSYSTNINIMGTTARTNAIDEDNILISTLGTGSGNATRVNAGSTGDNPTPVYTSWTANSSVAAYEAVVRGAVLRHDQTDYSSGYLPAGPDYSSGRNGTQYFQIELIRSNVSEFRITYSGAAAGCFVCMPDNSAWTTSLSGTNGWADMFQAYRGAGIPTSSEPGCSSGGLMDNNGGTFTCVFGTESSSNDSNNRILIRWKLTSGQSITGMSFSAT